MVSKTVLLLVLVFATVLLITSEIAAAKDLASKHDSEVEDAKHSRDDRGYHNGGRGGYYNGGGGRGGDHGNGGYYNGGGHRGNNCRHGCCGGGRYYSRGCRCCSTLAEATAYKQAHAAAQTHN